MNTAKATVKSLCPPFLWKLGRSMRSKLRTTGSGATFQPLAFEGPFASWREAVQQSDGWDSPVITEKALAAALKVRDGIAAFEQDTIVCDRIVYSPTILAFLALALARQRDRLDILDFGGGLATNYFQHRKILGALPLDLPVRWSIVERPIFAQLGNQHFARRGLEFFASLDDAVEALDAAPEAFLFSGSLQCVEAPLALLDRVDRLGATILAFDRLIVSPDSAHRIYVQRPDPHHYYAATYPTWCFARTRFVDEVQAMGFELVEEFTDHPNERFDHCGMVFVR